MKIKRISCTQFAGIRDQSVSLTGGINVIYGQNESGKSTLVHLLARTLFQSAKLDGRSDRAFRALYFPAERRGGRAAADFVDGTVTIECENGTYTLTKAWGEGAGCTLSTPDGAVRDPKKIEELLRGVLLYGEGVYNDILLTSQREQSQALETLLDAARKTEAKREIARTAARALAESGDVSVEAVGAAIGAKRREIEGAHWDAEHNRPEKRASGRWSKEIGEILKAYYALEDAKETLDRVAALEDAADAAADEYAAADAAAAEAERTFQAFHGYAGRLEAQSERKHRVKNLDAEIEKLSAVLNEWPSLIAQRDAAALLKAEQEQRALLDQYERAKTAAAEARRCSERCDALPAPSEQETREALAAERELRRLENRLCGMNLSARLRMLDGRDYVLRSLRTGEPLRPEGGTFNISEAVSLTVPGVMELTLAPADVDADAVGRGLEAQRNRLEEICARYSVRTAEELQALSDARRDAENELSAAESRLTLALGGTELAALEAAALEIPASPREKQEIDSAIRTLCGGDVARFLAAKETLIERHQEEHGTTEALKRKLDALREEAANLRASCETDAGTPSEFLNIADPVEHLAALRERLGATQRRRDAALTKKSAAVAQLEAFREALDGDPLETTARAEERLREQQELLARWKRIEAAYLRRKSALSETPMQDISEHFARYLDLISHGRVASEFPRPDLLEPQLYSSERLLDYEKLSEGTKDAVALAFRLAVLEHLFPEGGGVVVLDDPFTDMDAERTEQACALLREFAGRHQVIFLTCREEYLAALGGNEIRMP